MKKDELKEYINRDIESLRAMNFSENYIKSMTENTSKWAAIGLLGGIEDTHVGRTIATLLENQRLFNEKDDDSGPQWKRISIPLMRRVFAESFVGYKLISVQAMRSSQENLYLSNFEGRTIPMISEANSRIIARWNPPPHGDHAFSLDAEAEKLAEFANEIQAEFSKEIIRDLTLNAGKTAKYEYKDEDHLFSLIEGMSAYIGAKCFNREATWIVASPAVVKLLEKFVEPVENLEVEDQREGISYIGTIAKKWRLYEDCSSSRGSILMGLKDNRNHYFSGYIFAPYLPASLMPTNEKQSQVIARYGKRLLNPGFYGSIQIENLPDPTPLKESDKDESEE